ncbi:MAG: GGDEF domain-containing protein [Acidimicrobiales bacterium]|nr:GGDEF domain-containing protein [Acidimicrobiales bacterium]
MEDLESHAAVAERAVLNATRSLLHIEHASDVREIAVTLVNDLGGELVEAGENPPDALPVDMSFGSGPPLLALPMSDVARMRLERFLPSFVEDGTRALALVRTTDRLAVDAGIDPLTGLANRRASGRVLGRVRAGDVVVYIDFDHFKELNDSLGHGEGDRVLKEFGATLRDGIRQQDHAGRRGGEEFIVVVTGATVDDARTLCNRLRAEWTARRPHAVGFSAGIAVVRPGANTLVAADRALYRAKELGRGQDQVAQDEDYQ